MDDGAATRAYWLTQGMARALGINLSTAIRSGGLSRAGLERLVDRCAQCPHAGECLGWLAHPQGQAPTLPDYCPNRAALGALRPRRH